MMSAASAVFVTALSFLVASEVLAANVVTFEQHIKPVFRQHCQACHSQDDASSGLALDDYNATLAGGVGGEVVASGDVDSSRLWKLVTHQEQPAMPPGGDKLPDDQLSLLKAWIKGGLLKDTNSKPKPSSKPAIAQLSGESLGKPSGQPAMPGELFRQPLLFSETPGPVLSLTASRWAPVIAIPWQYQVSLYHAKTYQLLGILPFVDGEPQVVRFSLDGELLLVAGGRQGAVGKAVLFDVKTGARLATLGDELDIVLAADISPDNTLVAIGGPKKKVRVYRVADNQLAYTLSKHTDWVTSVAFSPNGKLIATADRSSGLRTWDTRKGFERGELRGHAKHITSLAWRSDSMLLASASEDGTVRLWNPQGKQVKSIAAHPAGALSVAFASDGKLVTSGRDRRAKLWKPDGGHLADLPLMDHEVAAVAFTFEGQKVVTADFAGNVTVIDVESKQQVATLPPNPPKLEQRLASIEKAIRDASAENQVLATKFSNSEAALYRGRAEHDDYLKRLDRAEAAQQLAEQQLTLSATLVEEAKGHLSEAEARLATAEVALNKESNKEESKEGEKTNDNPGLSEDADKVHAETKAAVAAAKRHSDEATKRYQELETNLAVAGEKLASVRGQHAGLPDLASLKKAVSTAQLQVLEGEKRLSKLNVERTRLVEELDAFVDSAANLAQRATSSVKEASEYAQILGAAKASRDQTAEKFKQHEQSLASVQEQLARLQSRVQELHEQRIALKESLQNEETEVANAERRLAKQQQAALIAEALLRDYTAAEAARKVLSKSRADADP